MAILKFNRIQFKCPLNQQAIRQESSHPKSTVGKKLISLKFDFDNEH